MTFEDFCDELLGADEFDDFDVLEDVEVVEGLLQDLVILFHVVPGNRP